MVLFYCPFGRTRVVYHKFYIKWNHEWMFRQEVKEDEKIRRDNPGCPIAYGLEKDKQR